jgi:hypothetical protein
LDEQDSHQRPRPSCSQNASVVYGLGFLGASVWYWKQANGFRGHVAGVAKALVWPAFLVYDAFKALND